MRSIRHAGQPVKPKRAYDATHRRQKARFTRDRIIDVAEQRLLRDGYAATTISAIADEAGVSVDTIYKTFGGKPGLVRAIRTKALRGEAPVPAEQRSDELQLHEPDARAIIAGWGRLVAELAPRASPILLLVRDAASTHPELRALLEELDGDRLQRMTDNARRLHAAGHLRAGITIQQAADVLWTYGSPELYELLVLRRGMAVEEYGRFVAEAMSAAVL